MDVPGQALAAGRYEVRSRLGVGGMGAVFEAWDPQLRRLVALKFLREEYEDDADVRTRFVREALTMSRLSHPRILRVFEVEAKARRPFLVEELLEGEDLEQRLRRGGPLPPGEARQLAGELADALACLHDHDVVHRDLKPSNVFLARGRGAVLLDFGLALDLDRTRLTQTNVLLGTVCFLSPEQIRGDRPGPASDVYQLGLLLHLALTGRVHDRPGTPDWDALARVGDLRGPTPAPDPGLPHDLHQLIARCCRKVPAERPGDGRALLALLGSPDGATGGLPRLPTGQTTDALPPEAPPRRRRPVLPMVAATVAAGLCIFAASGWLAPPSVAPRPPRARLLEEEWARFPDGVFVSFAVNDDLRAELVRGARRVPLPLRRQGGRLAAEVVGLAPADGWRLLVADGQGDLLERRFDLPATSLDGPPRFRLGPLGFSARWRLHGRARVDVVVDEDDGEGPRSRGAHLDRCTLPPPAKPRERTVAVRLELGSRVLASGTLRDGFRVRLPDLPAQERQLRVLAPLHAGGGGTVEFMTQSGAIVSLGTVETSTGAMLEPRWAHPSRAGSARTTGDSDYDWAMTSVGGSGLLAVLLTRPAVAYRVDRDRQTATFARFRAERRATDPAELLSAWLASPVARELDPTAGEWLRELPFDLRGSGRLVPMGGDRVVGVCRAATSPQLASFEVSSDGAVARSWKHQLPWREVEQVLSAPGLLFVILGHKREARSVACLELGTDGHRLAWTWPVPGGPPDPGHPERQCCAIVAPDGRGLLVAAAGGLHRVLHGGDAPTVSTHPLPVPRESLFSEPVIVEDGALLWPVMVGAELPGSSITGVSLRLLELDLARGWPPAIRLTSRLVDIPWTLNLGQLRRSVLVGPLVAVCSEPLFVILETRFPCRYVDSRPSFYGVRGIFGLSGVAFAIRKGGSAVGLDVE